MQTQPQFQLTPSSIGVFDAADFYFDESKNGFFNPRSNFYFDAASGYFYHTISGVYYYYNPHQGIYLEYQEPQTQSNTSHYQPPPSEAQSQINVEPILSIRTEHIDAEVNEGRSSSTKPESDQNIVSKPEKRTQPKNQRVLENMAKWNAKAQELVHKKQAKSSQENPSDQTEPPKQASLQQIMGRLRQKYERDHPQHICLICRRALPSSEKLNAHYQRSTLHQRTVTQEAKRLLGLDQVN